MEIQELEKESKDLIVQAQGMIITNQEQYETSADFLQTVKAMQKKIKESFNIIIEKAHRAHKEAVAQRDKHLQPLKEAESIVKKGMITYTEEQNRKAQEEQQRLQALADKEAELQRKRLEARITNAVAKGKEEKAEELRLQQEQIEAIAPVVTPQVETPKGVSYSTRWSAEVIDANLVPREYLVPNQQALDAVARATKGSISIPGVKFVAIKTLAQRQTR